MQACGAAEHAIAAAICMIQKPRTSEIGEMQECIGKQEKHEQKLVSSGGICSCLFSYVPDISSLFYVVIG